MTNSNAGVRGAALFALFATLVLGAFAIDRQSLWLDELGTWRLTLADSWPDWADQLLSQRGSNVQMPLYHLFMRAWTQLFGASEFALRASNLPWLFIAFFALFASPVPRVHRRTALLIAVVLLVHPMTWYYANEVRPYAMMFAGTALAGSGLLERLAPDRDASRRARANAFALAGLVLLVWTSPIGLVWALAFALPLWLLGRDGGTPAAPRAPARRFAGTLVAALIALACAYYFFTYLSGVEPTTLHEHSVANFAFGLYEIAGLSGVGPGREELRQFGAIALAKSLIPIAACALCVGVVAAVGAAHRFRNNVRSALVVFGSALLSLAIVFALAATAHWRVVGRHLLPLVWFFALALATGIDRLVEIGERRASGLRRPAAALLAALALLALAASSFEIATARRHEREEYREAARIALAGVSKGGTVWWVAAPYGASYYGLDPAIHAASSARAGGRVFVVVNREPRELASLPEPDAVLLSRRDTYDMRGAVSDYLARNAYRRDDALLGFEVWTR